VRQLSSRTQLFNYSPLLQDFIKNPTWMRRVTWGLFAIWMILSAIGAIAILGGARQP
jgi:hypothetical protein